MKGVGRDYTNSPAHSQRALELAPTVVVTTAEGQRVHYPDMKEQYDIQVGGFRVVSGYGGWIRWGPDSWGAGLKLSDDANDAPPAGTPVRVEYWVEAAGERVHGVAIVDDWTYDISQSDQWMHFPEGSHIIVDERYVQAIDYGYRKELDFGTLAHVVMADGSPFPGDATIRVTSFEIAGKVYDDDSVSFAAGEGPPSSTPITVNYGAEIGSSSDIVLRHSEVIPRLVVAAVP